MDISVCPSTLRSRTPFATTVLNRQGHSSSGIGDCSRVVAAGPFACRHNCSGCWWCLFRHVCCFLSCKRADPPRISPVCPLVDFGRIGRKSGRLSRLFAITPSIKSFAVIKTSLLSFHGMEEVVGSNPEQAPKAGLMRSDQCTFTFGSTDMPGRRRCCGS